MNLQKREILVTNIKSTIDKYLEYCNEENTPYVCKLKNTKGGVENIHNFILKCMFDKQMEMGESLSNLERYLDPNYLTD
tara:strand:+ start:1445 stop:1681 length:237 start_codon:yes stop_codon:yes gene_type:complete